MDNCKLKVELATPSDLPNVSLGLWIATFFLFLPSILFLVGIFPHYDRIITFATKPYGAQSCLPTEIMVLMMFYGLLLILTTPICIIAAIIYKHFYFGLSWIVAWLCTFQLFGYFLVD